MSPAVRPLKTAKQIAYEIGVSESTLRRMVKKGLVPVTKSGCRGRTSPLQIDRQTVHKLTLSNREE
ncbi:hypothetical protein [Azorhizobium sp. AG788]|uniref:helix-turn-helix transcriptional regulator n=1 Tax=Azorhizobium sp. AG788 TaxID=2183897 RepID=UPI003139C7F1